MAIRGGGGIRATDHPRDAADSGARRPIGRRLSVDRPTLLAVWLALVMVLSVVAFSTAGAAGGTAPAFAAGDDAADGDVSVLESAPPPGEGKGGGSPSGTSSSDASNGGSGASGGGDDGEKSSNGSSDGDNGSDEDGNAGGTSKKDTTENSKKGSNEKSKKDSNGEANGRPNGAGERTSGGNAGAGGPPTERPAGSGPSVDVSVGRPDEPGRSGSAAGSAGSANGAAPPSVVSVSVKGVEKGQSVALDVSPPAVEREAVAFDGVSATVKRGGEFTLEITSSRERLPGSPEFDTDDGAEALGRIRLDHSITNEELEDVSFDFRVSKARLRASDTDPEDVALYRHADGTWTALPTDLVGETGTHYLLRAESPGMSEFAVGAMQPSFETWWAGVADESVDAGESTRISGRVTNVGGADGVYEATLEVDGQVVDRRRVTVAAGGTRQVNFVRRFERPGTYEVSVNEVTAGAVEVDEGSGDASSSTDRRLSIGLEMLLDLGRAVATPVPSGPGA